MVNVIVVAVVIVLLGFALKGTLKHLKGESPCCGGGDTIIIEDKKLDGPVIGKKTVKISGMHCDHCVRAVTEAINKIDGASAKVNLKKKEAVVSYEKVVEDAAIREAVEKAGIYRTEHSGLSYVKLQHCSACKNETGFLIAFQKKICYNNSVGSKEIWRSALFSFMTIECSQSVHSTVSTKAALISICRFSGEESSDSKYKR